MLCILLMLPTFAACFFWVLESQISMSDEGLSMAGATPPTFQASIFFDVKKITAISLRCCGPESNLKWQLFCSVSQQRQKTVLNGWLQSF